MYPTFVCCNLGTFNIFCTLLLHRVSFRGGRGGAFAPPRLTLAPPWNWQICMLREPCPPTKLHIDVLPPLGPNSERNTAVANSTVDAIGQYMYLEGWLSQIPCTNMYLVDVTCPNEQSENLVAARRRKIEKYQSIKDRLTEQGFDTTLDAFVVGIRKTTAYCLSLGSVGSTVSCSRNSAVVTPFLAVTRCGPADAGGTSSGVSPDKSYQPSHVCMELALSMASVHTQTIRCFGE